MSIAWAPATFVSDLDLKYHTLTGQTAGDISYANTTTTIARLPISTNGTFLQATAGFPAWVDATGRLDLGNSGATLTIVRSPLNQHQKLTLSANATLTIDVSQIPSGGFLILDVYQNGVAAKTLAWAVNAGTLGWVNGGGTTAPTMTPTLSRYDRYVFEKNETTILTAWAAFQNAT